MTRRAETQTNQETVLTGLHEEQSRDGETQSEDLILITSTKVTRDQLMMKHNSANHVRHVKTPQSIRRVNKQQIL